MDQFFSEEDLIGALKSSGTGMWKLETCPGGHNRFWGDPLMNELAGVPDEIGPEDRFAIFFSRIYKDDMELFLEYSRTLDEKGRAEVVYRYNHPKRGVIYVRCGGDKVFVDTNTEVSMFMGFHQDVTNTYRVEQDSAAQVTMQAELFKTLSYKILAYSTDYSSKINLKTGEFYWMNTESGNLEKCPPYEEMVANVRSWVPDEYVEEFNEKSRIETVREKLADRDEYHFSVFVHRPMDGEFRRLSYSFYRIQGDEIISLFKDSTEEYEKEKQLADALLSAKQANAAKTVFLSNMSHDIRTPMNAIIGFSELAEKNIDDPVKAKDYLEKIKTSSKHLLSLINDVLDMSRIESGRMHINEEDNSLSEIFENLRTILQTDAKNKDIEFTIDYSEVENDKVVTDKLKMNQLLLNCVSNALKFTPEGGKVSVVAKQINASNTQCGYGEYVFTIKDNGIGMSEEFITKVFEPFSREENAAKQIQGTGLGMSICKSIVEMMQGTIEVESKLGEGTQFTIRLPLKLVCTEQEDEVQEEQTIDYKAMDGKRVLLAEDNEMNREIATAILEEVGIVVETAEDGSEAVEAIKNNTPGYYDLVLMDIQMPVMNGYEATRAIRSMDREDASKIKIVAMTANAFEEDRREAIASGMNGHLTKPIDIDRLFRTIENMVD